MKKLAQEKEKVLGLIQHGDLLLSKFAKLRVGDIILYDVNTGTFEKIMHAEIG
ncbi:MAG: hypothetical protein WC759_00015 [Candidatus Micrarchaeia archaeon]